MTRERILHGAHAILDAGVYADLTVDGLTRFLRMSKSTLYKHFVSKEALIVSLVDHVCDDADGRLEAIAEASAAAQLTQVLEVFAAFGERLPRAVVLEADRLPAACRVRLRVTQAHLAGAIREALQRGASSGELQIRQPALAATALAASARAAIEAAARAELEISRTRAVRDVLELFRPGFVEHSPSA